MTQTPQPAPHHLCFRLVDQQSTPIRDARRYTLTWTDQGATTATTREGTTNDQGRTEQIQTRGPVLVTLAIAPPAGGECRPVNQAVSSKPEGRYPVVTVRLAFNATTATMPQSQDHCETLTLRAGQQRVKYVIDNVDTIRNNGRDYATYLTNFPYLIVDAATLEVLHAGTTRTEPARFTGNRSQVQTAEVAVDGVARVGIVLGAAANGDEQRWRDDAANLVMYRVVPAAEGLTTVTITERAAEGPEPQENQVLTALAAQSPSVHTGDLNGRVWRTFTRSYGMADIRRWITGQLTLDVQGGITTWYEIAQPSERQIAWAEQHGQISPEQAAQYRNAPPQPRNPGRDQGAPPPPALRMQLEWADLLDPIYSGQIENIPQPNRRRSQGGDIIIPPLDLTIRLAPGFSDNAEEITGLNQAQVLTHNHPFVYMMLLSACAQAGVTHVKIVGSWRPMLGSILHKLGDALDITEVDSRPDRLPAFTFNGSHVRNNALADRFGSLLHDHRYARPDQHIYVGDDYPHTSDASHNNHLHITCNSRVALQPRDLAGYRGAADPPAQPGRPLPAVPEELQRRNQVR
ncbi:hypothetical protein JR065_18820 [Xanthomonas sp. AmX2]|uniref:hypothetical protein n=1 Tax=Xanthomonas sp. TaxID=29446 RepID=UPI00197DF162|nr:hypothetical protein [Xanthomonas sp.]MBN6152397.1 hypothetical protein [Xanthomonas sp.]